MHHPWERVHIHQVMSHWMVTNMQIILSKVSQAIADNNFSNTTWLPVTSVRRGLITMVNLSGLIIAWQNLHPLPWVTERPGEGELAIRLQRADCHLPLGRILEGYFSSDESRGMLNATKLMASVVCICNSGLDYFQGWLLVLQFVMFLRCPRMFSIQMIIWYGRMGYNYSDRSLLYLHNPVERSQLGSLVRILLVRGLREFFCLGYCLLFSFLFFDRESSELSSWSWLKWKPRVRGDTFSFLGVTILFFFFRCFATGAFLRSSVFLDLLEGNISCAK